MGSVRTAMKHRIRQHQHALVRLRERYLPDAEMADVIAIRNLARAARGFVSDTGCKPVFVTYRGVLMHVIYVPHHDAVRTILPRIAPLTPARPRHGG